MAHREGTLGVTTDLYSLLLSNTPQTLLTILNSSPLLPNLLLLLYCLPQGVGVSLQTIFQARNVREGVLSPILFSKLDHSFISLVDIPFYI